MKDWQFFLLAAWVFASHGLSPMARQIMVMLCMVAFGFYAVRSS